LIPRWARLGLHSWLGLLIVFAVWVNWAVGLVFAAYFGLYERWEADRIKDKAYRDVAETMWGIAIAVAVWGLAKCLIMLL